MRLHLILFLLLTIALTTAAQTRPTDDSVDELRRLVLSDNNARSLTIRRYDRFENRTRYWTVTAPVKEGLDLAAHFSFKGRGAGHEIEGFYLSFQSAAPDWQFLKQSRLLCLIDGKSYDLGGPVARDNEVKTEYQSVETRELLMYSVSLKTLSFIANAQNVEMRLGNAEFTLPEGFRDAVRELIGKVQVVNRKRGNKRNRD